MDGLLFVDQVRQRAYISKVRATAPIGYWPLDDAAGSPQARNLAQTTGNLVSNGDFEHATDLKYWLVSAPDGSVAVEPDEVHGGAKAVKLTCGTSGNTYLDQTFPLTIGKTYTLTFWTRGDGTRGGGYDLYDVTNNAYVGAFRTATGVTGTTYQQVTREFTVPPGCKKIMLRFYCPQLNTAYCYFDDAAIQDVVPSASALNATFGQAGIGDGRTAASLAGNAAIDVYSAAFASAFDGDEGTCSLWFAESDAANWTDGTQDVALEILAQAGSGGFHFAKTSVDGIFQATRVVAGGTVSCNWDGLSDTGWHHVVMAWSKSQGKIYGSMSGAYYVDQDYSGDWAGTLLASSTCIGGYDNAGVTQPFKGRLAHVAVWNRCLSAATRKMLART